MSDFKPLKAREIKLKPIQFKVEEPEQIGDSPSEVDESLSDLEQLEQKKAHLNDELNQLKQELTKVHQQIEADRQQAEQDINQKKQDWQLEKETLIESAKNEGYQAGHETGEQAALADFSSRIEKANEIIHQAEQEREIIIDKAHADIVELAMVVAKKVVFDAVMSNDALLPIVKTAIKDYHDQTIIRIRTSIQDFDLIHSQTDELTRVLNDGVMLSVLPDDKLPIGGCVIETPSGQLDVSVDRQLEKIHEALTETMEEMPRGH
ncbi:flagellar assembly protein FliH [Halolactibacillus halophilus]|uniref:Flagellar assembly protein FliH n=1 Tax=Halolactibacillus halophilus TaxID=306540 RepID=A0ABQ0VL29_9BACI|nr:flagellar assembly protein FliH [Halolactibacillus halophilus]GEM00769.1 flagellar assembly protein FliH [Halolactibacillus halophilus]